mmetsp:Transcript_27752/g.38607  ORF Transcript_27752/g.38607 Transcript_27752/m.38607 type:complete len:282 (-) Transcript_27752:229-1074(-)|eukprot:CAMPEP_0201488192 /NCGR_PEP_ID=MMETSP0151_2-20130828/17565_1 /ASSEMBLY_ACC=CAM_ASM_000257 /TAXON_ID=200890 /ORGANISM="Paramoeba atlantica, Strain 621/1 / CCAP 1560/9" /LENGTH=281 /DNA_ID=CAMNT_0047873433 /DNA_START=74 /DNA_END=919 /DNA_ORIENTATION=-
MFSLEWANSLSIPYEFIKKLGRGHYGEVYEGVHRETGEKRALKVVKTGTQGFQNEVNIMKRLPSDHPHIVQMHGSFSLSASLFVFVLELCDTDLKEFIQKEGGKLKEEDALQVMKGLASGLAGLRKSEVFHRDLKPENIFVNVVENGGDREIEVKLGDFGLSARISRPKQLFFGLTGSPYYVAPEIWSNRGYTCAADLYSCGVIFYEMMTGNPLFFGVAFNKYQLKKLALQDGFCLEKTEIDLSTLGKDLLSCLLQRVPNERIELEDFCLHPWLNNAVMAG